MSLEPSQITMEEMTDPEELTKFQAPSAQTERNAAWLEAHAPKIYQSYRGKFIIVAGEELFIGNIPEDHSRLVRHIYPQKMVRIYAN